MQNQEALAVGGLVDRVARHHHSAEVYADEVAHPVVVVAGHVDHVHALAGHAQDLLDHVVVRLRPVPARAQLPAVDDVADQIERLALHMADEVEQQLGLTALGAQMDVGNEDGPVLADGDT